MKEDIRWQDFEDVVPVELRPGNEPGFWDHSHPRRLRDSATAGAVPGHPSPGNGRAASAPRPPHPGRCTACSLQATRNIRGAAPWPSLVHRSPRSTPPDPPPAHLKSATAEQLQLLLSRPRNNSTFPRGAEVSPNSRTPVRTTGTPAALLRKADSALAQPSSLGLRFLKGTV